MSPILLPETTAPRRWLRPTPGSVYSLSFEELRVTVGGQEVWVTVESSAGETHRFLAYGLLGKLTNNRVRNALPLVLTDVTPAIGEWTEVDETGFPVRHQRPVITITADRQIGKTDLLLLVAARDAAFLNKWVIYEAHNHQIAEHTMRRFIDYIEHVIGAKSLIEKAYWTNGDQHVRLWHTDWHGRGGMVRFRSAQGRGPWQGVADTHIVDDAELPRWRYGRDGVPATVYHSVCTGDGQPL